MLDRSLLDTGHWLLERAPTSNTPVAKEGMMPDSTTTSSLRLSEVHDQRPDSSHFLADVLEGLTGPEKSIPCKYLYDERGSRLFDGICGLEEYYPTRTEMEILRRNIIEIADCAGPACQVVEPGSGSGTKTKFLLDHLEDLHSYVPVDISRRHLARAAEDLARKFRKLRVTPVCADFTQPFEIAESPPEHGHRLIFFPGSTIGNFMPHRAGEILALLAEVAGPRGALLIGVDLPKDQEVLERAYNDSKGITAAFNLNLLARINRELGADFDLSGFEHHAVFNSQESRIEMYLVSLRRQTVTIAEEEIEFQAGQAICTEWSYKHDLSVFEELASYAGWKRQQVWTDDRDWFSVQYFTHDIDLGGLDAQPYALKQQSPFRPK